MKRRLIACLMLLAGLPSSAFAQEEEAGDKVYPVAIFAFQERGVAAKGQGQTVADLLFASLAASPDLYLVEREELQKSLGEQKLNLSGILKPDEAVQVGQLTGAKILLTGSVIEADPNIYVVAKIIGTENGRVLGQSVKGKTSDDLGTLIDELAQKVQTVISEDGSKLVVEEPTPADRAATIRKQIKGDQRPTVYVSISERHIGTPTIDPAAETEVMFLLRETGFPVADTKAGGKKAADLVLEGEGFSETAGRIGDLISVRARVEVKVVDRQSGEVIAVDRQTAIVVDLSEQLAGKAALQQAAAELSQRLLPKLAPSAKSGKK